LRLNKRSEWGSSHGKDNCQDLGEVVVSPNGRAPRVISMNVEAYEAYSKLGLPVRLPDEYISTKENLTIPFQALGSLDKSMTDMM
jgi:hypothetical protein